MKVQVCSYLLTAVMIFSGLAVGVSGSEKVNIKENAVAFNIVSTGYLFLPQNGGVWCDVSTTSGNLNVRNLRGKIVAKLANGQDVWVDGYQSWSDGTEWGRVNVKKGGKLRFLGYASMDYIACG